MKVWVLLILVLGIAQEAQSQAQDKAALPVLTVEQQRAHIQQLKAQQEARFAREESGCQAKFAVTDCVTDVRRRRREVIADLNRQESSLTSQQRKAQGGDQLIRLENKAARSSDRLAGQATAGADPPVPEQAASQAVQVRQPKAPKAPKSPSAPVVQPVPAGDKALEAAKKAEYRSLKEKKYKEKIRAAEEYRKKKETEQAAKPVRKLQPLPVPVP